MTTSPSEIWQNIQAEDCKCHRQYCLWGLIWSSPLARNICDPNMSTDTHLNHVSSKIIPGRKHCIHTRPLHSVNPCLITSTEISTGLPAIFCHFSPPPTQFLWWVFEDLSSTLFFLSLSLFLTRQILREVDVKTRQSRDVKNINTIFLLSRGKGGDGEGWG